MHHREVVTTTTPLHIISPALIYLIMEACMFCLGVYNSLNNNNRTVTYYVSLFYLASRQLKAKFQLNYSHIS